ncbi:MAG: hypothetical protein GXP16_15070 [Gammaproteobacteria bacterium]|nr:hypothetical protein [Gammaproteobacteria bacterium]
MRLETKRLICRSIHASRQQLLAIIQHNQESGLARFGVERKDKSGLTGYCGFKPTGDFVDLRYQYCKPAWGHGFGLEAAMAIRYID